MYAVTGGALVVVNLLAASAGRVKILESLSKAGDRSKEV
jgi:hypothetical protein